MPTDELYGAYNYLLEISGTTAGTFQTVEVRPLETEDPARGSQPAFRRVAPPPDIAGARTPQTRRSGTDVGGRSLKRGLTGAGSVSHKVNVAGHKVRPRAGERESSAEPDEESVEAMPHRLKWSDITLKRGHTSATAAGNPAGMKWNAGLKWNPGLKWNEAEQPSRGGPRPATRGVSTPSPQQQQSKIRLDSLGHKVQPAVLFLGGFVGSGAAIPDVGVHQGGRIVLADPNGRPVAQWSFQHAWPAKCKVPEPKSRSGETVALIVERIRRG